MTTVLGYFGGGSTVELPAPDTIRHNCPVYAAKAFETFSVFLRAQEWKAAITTDRPFFGDNVLGNLVLGIAAWTDQMCRASLRGFGIGLGFRGSHKASGLVLNGMCLRACVRALPVVLIRFRNNC